MGERLSKGEEPMEIVQLHQAFGALHPWNSRRHFKSRASPNGESLADVLQPDSVVADLATNQRREVGERLAMTGQAKGRGQRSDALEGL